jgi:hypothetical protein
MYIFMKFINSLPKPWLNKVGYINKIGYTNKIGCIGKIGYKVSEVKVGVLVVLILAKLFLKR